jgi:hypothetical protein
MVGWTIGVKLNRRLTSSLIHLNFGQVYPFPSAQGSFDWSFPQYYPDEYKNRPYQAGFAIGSPATAPRCLPSLPEKATIFQPPVRCRLVIWQEMDYS